MTDPIACSYADAELNHLRDALALDTAHRWQWLRPAMDFGFAIARDRANRGLVTLGPHGEELWSPEREREWGKASSAARQALGLLGGPSPIPE